MPAAPAFWGEKPGLRAELLAPLAAAWDAAGRLRRAAARAYRAPVPVLCIGNLVAGGAGKTPIVLSLSAELSRRGVAVHVVTRGYGGRLRGPLRVDPAAHDAGMVGDEALLLAARGPCWIARDRAAGLRAAADAGAALILLDDGFQNPSVAKTRSWLVVDGAYGFGNGRVMPAGPLREGIACGLARADAVVLIGAATRELRASLGDRLPVVPAALTPLDGARFAGARVVAFAGIARPERFFGLLQRLGAAVVDARSFPDHHRFTAAEIAALRRAAAPAGARLVTTAKDIVRLPPPLRAGIEVLEVAIVWPEPARRDALLDDLLAAPAGLRP